MRAVFTPEAVLSDLAKLSHSDELARLVHTLAFAAYDERKPHLADGLFETAERMNLSFEQAETPYGNVLRLLERGAADAVGGAGRALLSTLFARGVALESTQDSLGDVRVAEALLWLSTHTSVDALFAVDAAVGQRAGALWAAISDLIRRADGGTGTVGRGAALIAAVSLTQSASPVAARKALELSSDVRDPLLQYILEQACNRTDPALLQVRACGSSALGPRSTLAFVLLLVTGILPVIHLLRLAARLVLQYRSTIELAADKKGLTLHRKTRMVGRMVREVETHFPRTSLLRITRDVRYPRLSLSVGLFFLAVGSYFGLSFIADGVRARSPSMLAMGALVVAFSVGLDLLVNIVSSSSNERCRLVVVPRGGKPTTIDGVPFNDAERVLDVCSQSA